VAIGDYKRGRNRAVGTMAAVIGALLLLISASCSTVDTNVSSSARLLREVEGLAANPSLRAAVLARVRFLNIAGIDQLGERYANDAERDIQNWSQYLLLHRNRARDLIEGLGSGSSSVRRISAQKAGTLALRGDDSEQLDSMLKRAILAEENGSAFQAACIAYVQRQGSAGAQFVFDAVAARGPRWQPYAAEALGLYPDHRFADYFRAAIVSRRFAVEGRRGLMILGSVSRTGRLWRGCTDQNSRLVSTWSSTKTP
jgi:hypothetical protein